MSAHSGMDGKVFKAERTTERREQTKAVGEQYWIYVQIRDSLYALELPVACCSLSALLSVGRLVMVIHYHFGVSLLRDSTRTPSKGR